MFAPTPTERPRPCRGWPRDASPPVSSIRTTRAPRPRRSSSGRRTPPRGSMSSTVTTSSVGCGWGPTAEELVVYDVTLDRTSDAPELLSALIERARGQGARMVGIGVDPGRLRAADDRLPARAPRPGHEHGAAARPSDRRPVAAGAASDDRRGVRRLVGRRSRGLRPGARVHGPLSRAGARAQPYPDGRADPGRSGVARHGVPRGARGRRGRRRPVAQHRRDDGVRLQHRGAAPTSAGAATGPRS